MGMTKFDLFALVVFGMAVLGLAAWRQIKRVGGKFEADFKAQCEENEKRYVDAADKIRRDHEKTTQMNLDRYNEKIRTQGEIDESWRRRKVYEADSYNAACNAVETDEYKRRLNAGIANQAASMEPFCGEGKKP